jgi:hypothetical protein
MSRTANTAFGRCVWILAAMVLAACSGPNPATPELADDAPNAAAGVTAFSGARLIVGDGTVIDNAVFTVGPDNRFGIVGPAAVTCLPAPRRST